MSRSSGKAWCDFCGKREDTVLGMIQGPAERHICDECVAIAERLLRDRVVGAWRTDVIVRLESFDAPRTSPASEDPATPTSDDPASQTEAGMSSPAPDASPPDDSGGGPARASSVAPTEGASTERARLYRNESSPVGKRVWAAIDKAADRAPEKAVANTKATGTGPTWVDQPGADECWIACLASLTGLPLDGFPQPPSERSRTTEIAYGNAVRAHLRAQGWTLVTVGRDVPAGYSIASGASPRREGFWHSVVYLDGVLAHDPHPDRVGLAGVPVGEYEVLVRHAGTRSPAPASPAVGGETERLRQAARAFEHMLEFGAMPSWYSRARLRAALAAPPQEQEGRDG